MEIVIAQSLQPAVNQYVDVLNGITLGQFQFANEQEKESNRHYYQELIDAYNEAIRIIRKHMKIRQELGQVEELEFEMVSTDVAVTKTIQVKKK
jgi:hypothetical protein